jgi:hypothetical protein
MGCRETAVDLYRKRYIDIAFERSGLFDLIRGEFHAEEVLYPGCSIHITPAFFFPYVVFVDRDPSARAFFSDRDTVFDMIRRRRVYRRTPYIRFLFRDFSTPLPVRTGQFDLILSLFTRGVAGACGTYLKTGGLLITNDLKNDAAEAVQANGLDMIAAVRKRQGRYRLVDGEPGGSFTTRRPAGASKRYLRQSNDGAEYIENGEYRIFRKMRRRP